MSPIPCIICKQRPLYLLRIELPTLQERREDIPLLIDSFIENKGKELGGISIQITPYAMKHLQSYEYPGNVRELFNILERIINRIDLDIISNNQIILTEEMIPDVLHPPAPGYKNRRFDDHKVTPSERLKNGSIRDLKVMNKAVKVMGKAQEMETIKRAIELSGGDISKSARLLNVHRTAIHRKIKKYKLESFVMSARKKKREDNMAR
jgi:sigma-54 dependent transcriptional regulator, acetoin dehydrogenase operon transcriptional activator AcoR